MLYSPIWNKIKATGFVEITTHKDKARTVIMGIKRTKSAENMINKVSGKITYSKLVITKTPVSSDLVKIRLELLYSRVV